MAASKLSIALRTENFEKLCWALMKEHIKAKKKGEKSSVVDNATIRSVFNALKDIAITKHKIEEAKLKVAQISNTDINGIPDGDVVELAKWLG